MSLSDKDQQMQFGASTSGELWRNISGKYNKADSADGTEEVVVDADKIEEVLEEMTAATQKPQTTVKSSFAEDTVHRIVPGQPVLVIVDDNHKIRSEYAEIFGRSGFSVVEANDGLEGLDRIKKMKPDAILTGIDMPRMDGYTLVESVKKDVELSRIPIFVCSHQGDMRDREKMQSLGVRDFILHGYMSREEIIDRIAVAIEESEGYIVRIDGSDHITQHFIKEHVNAVICPEEHTFALSLKRKEAGAGFDAHVICVPK